MGELLPATVDCAAAEIDAAALAAALATAFSRLNDDALVAGADEVFEPSLEQPNRRIARSFRTSRSTVRFPDPATTIASASRQLAAARCNVGFGRAILLSSSLSTGSIFLLLAGGHQRLLRMFCAKLYCEAGGRDLIRNPFTL